MTNKGLPSPPIEPPPKDIDKLKKEMIECLEKKTSQKLLNDKKNNDELVFPYETLDWMIEKSILNEFLNKKMIDIKYMNDIGRKNRSFGYYQRVGEELNLWTLDEIIVMVRNERNKKKAFIGIDK